MENKSKSGIKGFFKSNWILLFAIIYIVLPVDLIPDAIPFLGGLDDSAILILQLIKQYKAGK